MIRSQTFKTNQVFKLFWRLKVQNLYRGYIIETIQNSFCLSINFDYPRQVFPRLATDLHFFEINGPNWGSY